MPELNITIDHAVGLHARPAALFVQTAKRFASTITVRNGERKANAKSIVQVLTLGAKQGTELLIEAEGDDSQQALAALKTLIESHFEGAP
jgi:phosphocarrier protein HPr